MNLLLVSWCTILGRENSHTQPYTHPFGLILYYITLYQIIVLNCVIVYFILLYIVFYCFCIILYHFVLG
jgi:hypothetical protein